MILGTSAHKNGVKATMFTRRDLGIGWLSGEADDPKITRTFYVDNPGAEVVVTRARAMRETAGTLTGYALGDEQDTSATFDLLADVRTVFASVGGERIWHQKLLAGLIELRPDVYGSWDVRRLGAELRKLGVPTQQITEEIDGKPVNKRGCTWPTSNGCSAAAPTDRRSSREPGKRRRRAKRRRLR